MPNSLRCRIKSQMHKGLLSQKDGERLIAALDFVDAKCSSCKFYITGYCNEQCQWTPPWQVCKSYEKEAGGD